MTVELIRQPDSPALQDTLEHSKQELIGRIQGMAYNGTFGFAAYFYHEGPGHVLLCKALDDYYGLPNNDIDAHALIASGVILRRQLQRHPVSSEPHADDSELVIGCYYFVEDATALDV